MTQRTWFITGVSSGFGHHMTEQLLERGDHLAGTVRKMDAMNDLKAKYHDLLWLAHLDVTDAPDSSASRSHSSTQAMGGIDMTEVKARQIALAARPDGRPKLSDFRLEETAPRQVPGRCCFGCSIYRSIRTCAAGWMTGNRMRRRFHLVASCRANRLRQ